MWEPMAIAIIFGLPGATVLTPGVAPCVLPCTSPTGETVYPRRFGLQGLV